MAQASGLKLRGGWKREAVVTEPTWPAATAALLRQLLPLRQVHINQGITVAAQGDALNGSGVSSVDMVGSVPTASLTCALRYEGFEELLACALGFMAKRLMPGDILLPEVLVTNRVYRHLYEIDPHLGSAEGWGTMDGFQSGELLADQRKVRRGTLAVDFGHAVWEVLSTMVQRVTIAAGLEGTTLTLELGGYSLNFTSAVNTPAAFAQLPLSAAPSVLLHDLVLRIAPFSTSVALDAGDALGVQSLSLDYESALAQHPGPRTGLGPGEWERGAVPGVMLTLVLPRHSLDLWQTRFVASTDLMLDARFTGPLIGTTGVHYHHAWYCPRVRIVQADLQTSGAQPPSDTIHLQALTPTLMTEAAGFPVTHHPGPLQIEVVNTVAAHPLL